jgi:hypothetical protein
MSAATATAAVPHIISGHSRGLNSSDSSEDLSPSQCPGGLQTMRKVIRDSYICIYVYTGGPRTFREGSEGPEGS